MQRLSPPSGGAKKAASIVSPDPAPKAPSSLSAAAPNAPPASTASPPLILFKLDPPSFVVDTHPLPSDRAYDGTPSSLYPSALYRNVSRKAMNLLRPHLQGIGHQEIWMLTVDIEGNLSGSSCLAKGGLEHVQIALPDSLVRARIMGAKGIILMQNRLGPIEDGTPLDIDLSLLVDLVSALLGIPFIEHIFIDRVGKPFFAREQGLLQTTDPFVKEIRERLGKTAATIRESRIGPRPHVERRAARPAAAAPQEEEPLVYRPRTMPKET
jgi:RadC-like JAB domain